MRTIQAVRAGLGALRQPVGDDDDHLLVRLALLARVVPHDAEWSVVDVDRLDHASIPPAPTTTTRARLDAAFGDTQGEHEP